MAGTTVPARATGSQGSDVAALRLEFNKLVDDFDALVAKVTEIITEAGTDIAAVAAVDDAVPATAAKVADNDGATT